MLGRSMRRSFAVALLAGAVCACAAGSAIADDTRPITIRSGGNITARSLGAITFDSGLGVRVTCTLELTGTLVGGTIDAALAVQLGSVTRATASGCSGGSVTLLAEASNPWGLYVHDVVGTHPEAITGLSVWLTVRALASAAFTSCLYDGKIGGVLSFASRGSSTYTTGLLTLTTEREYLTITRLGGLLPCPAEPTISGSFALTTQTVAAAPPMTRALKAENAGIAFTGTATHRYTFRNTSGENVGPLNPARLQYVDNGFSIVDDRCRDATLSVNATCDVEVRFTAPGAEPLVDILEIADGGGRFGSTWVRALP